MANKQEYKIPFTGLKLGNHEFEFEVKDTFFESYEYSEIDKADCLVKLNMEKQSTMLVLTFFISGTVSTQCDRCTDEMSLEIEGEYGVIAKFTEREGIDTDEIIHLPSSEYQVDITEHIYQFIHLSLSSKRVHKEGECNQEMLEALDQYLVTDEVFEDSEEFEDNESDDDSVDVDPRWAALNKLKNEN